LNFSYFPQGGIGSDENYMVIRGRDCPTDQVLMMRFDQFIPNESLINFLSPTYADSCYPLYIGHVPEQGFIEYETLLNGSMELTTMTPYDWDSETPGKIEGTFEFTVTDERGIDTIRVTEGRFRFDVPQIF
jgi:hypothetical protein